ncbi:hypothetical protein [Dermacoccus nishinomiyaensis]|uniref:hypothetical protein n=1 Tax=Dermacoccus nishinomiyaensis TaxID=1274 RepID=UPI00248D7F44|nr:hypothetical protein [Dermacoccus nishinomiyaensis]
MTNKSKPTRTKINGLEVQNITYKNPGNGLPKFVREAAEARGFGDASTPLSLYVNDHDISEAFACAAQGNGSSCVMAQAGTRIGAKAVYFFRTTAWVDFGQGPIVRFQTAKSIYNNVIEPFDRGERDDVIPGIYHLMPPTMSQTLPSKRAVAERKPVRERSKSDGSRAPRIQSHTERVVIASKVA